jgi:enoyl-CoA hydratase/carnithine racemase
MIDLEIAEGVAFITLNAPATRSALNVELAAQFVGLRRGRPRPEGAPRSSRVPTARPAPGPNAVTWRAAAGTQPRRAGTRPLGGIYRAIFGEEISGLRAVQLGLAWEAVPSGQVEERAAAPAPAAAGGRARGGAGRPALVAAPAGRAIANPAVSWPDPRSLPHRIELINSVECGVIFRGHASRPAARSIHSEQPAVIETAGDGWL